LSVDTTELARRAAEADVGVVPGALFYADGRGADHLRLSFSMIDETLIDTGIARLASLV
jgi:2-aminoadipate transaminase